MMTLLLGMPFSLVRPLGWHPLEKATPLPQIEEMATPNKLTQFPVLYTEIFFESSRPVSLDI
jgi:hypothetical protein